MLELICHLLGDFVFQNHVMANRKLQRWRWAAFHALVYTLPFLVFMLSRHPRLHLGWNPVALAIICSTHFAIDRFGLAGYWMRFYGVGVRGWLSTQLHNWRREGYAFRWAADRPFTGNLEDGMAEYERLHPMPDPAPPFLVVWLTIAVDNTFHLLINHVALNW